MLTYISEKGPRESFSGRGCLRFAFRHSAFEFCDDPVEMSGCVMVDGGVCVCARVCAFCCLCTCACGGVTRQSPRQNSPKVTERRGSR